MATTSEKTTTAVAETTTTTTAKPPDVPGRIICFTEKTDQGDIDKTSMAPLKDLCSKIVHVISFSVFGDAEEDVNSLAWMTTYLGEEKFLTGTRMSEDDDLSLLEAITKTTEWSLSHWHGLTEVSLTAKTGEKLKKAAEALKDISVLTIKGESSEVDATLDAIPLFPGLDVVAITPRCEAFSWNRSDVLALANSINRQVRIAIALTFSAAIWQTSSQDKAEQDECSAWTDSTLFMMERLNDGVFGPLEGHSMAFEDNDTITALVNYSRHQGINAFCIRNAHMIVHTLPLHLQFHLLNFTLPPMPAKNRRPSSILLEQRGLDDSARSGSGFPAVRASSITGVDAEPVVSGIFVGTTEHSDMPGGPMASSSKSGKRKQKTS
ncbi:uncharacterized protein LOC142558071 [Dermacentor variabilis]|uniref:uncharacterized protein LOC142558071 n=1 Tax=Dermacentor variabilis TaxID=34621 RepID=UPI003F5C2FAE